jgi:hypothetical protein
MNQDVLPGSLIDCFFIPDLTAEIPMMQLASFSQVFFLLDANSQLGS